MEAILFFSSSGRRSGTDDQCFNMSEDTDYSYNFNTSESVVLTFDSYSPLHRLPTRSTPAPDYSNKKGYGVEGDFEFVVKK